MLANPLRLALLKHLLAGDERTVSRLAADARRHADTVSLALRALQARGLIAARRKGRWVYYSAEASATVDFAVPLLAAVRRAFAREVDIPSIIRDVTAFTHARRIVIVQALAPPGGHDPTTLALRCAISRPALYRHLHKLARRGLVAADADGCWRLLAPSGYLRRTLVTLARQRHGESPDAVCIR